MKKFLNLTRIALTDYLCPEKLITSSLVSLDNLRISQWDWTQKKLDWRKILQRVLYRILGKTWIQYQYQPKPVNNRPAYDMKYLGAYIVNYCYGTDLKKIIEIEWEYDTLSVVKLGQEED